MDHQIPELRKNLKAKLKSQRYEHSLSVSYTCISLAMKYGYSLDEAEVAGLLHDCAKHYDDDAILRHCIKHNIPVSECELKAPAVLHAKYGAWMIQNQYGIQEDAILHAVACHTTGMPNMKLLDKILYVADYIEPRRDQAPDLDHIRRLAYEDLDETVFRIMEGTLSYLKSKGAFVDPMT
ncbi:MAG: bis(5'-nucleosyl)-tetraphosphatase (symmetrical) YqeK, partial [Hungatella sp.]